MRLGIAMRRKMHAAAATLVAALLPLWTWSATGQEKSSPLKFSLGEAPPQRAGTAPTPKAMEKVQIVEMRDRGPPSGKLPAGTPGASFEPRFRPEAAANSPAAIPQTPGPATPASPGNANDIQPSSFRGVKPGVTTQAELQRAWGDPSKRRGPTEAAIWCYAFEPFSQVEAAIEDDRVASIVLRLAKPTDPAKLAVDLGLKSFRPAVVCDEAGVILGRVYPERGVLFSFAPEEESPLVAHIVLEPIAAEGFVLRVQHDLYDRLSQNLDDLRIALRMAPDDVRAYGLQASRLARLGRYGEALESVDQGISRQPDRPELHLIRAELLLERGEENAARAAVDRALRIENLSEYLRARAELLQGRILTEGRQFDPRQAVVHCEKAIEQGAAAAKDRNFVVRREAQLTVIEAHLMLARCVAGSNWKGKHESSQRWLDQAARLAKTLVEHDYGDMSKLSFWLLRGSLAAYAEDGALFDPKEAASAALDEGRRRITEADDPLLRRATEWELGMAAYHAMRVELERGNGKAAQQLAVIALEHLEVGAKDRDRTPHFDLIMGRVYYELGAAQALGAGKHPAAAAWYDRAAEHLGRLKSWLPPDDLGRLGEQQVTMGVSYWEVGAQARAIETTKAGLAAMQKAHSAGALDEAALAAPHANLASMFQTLGETQTASEHARIAEKIEGQGAKRR